MASSPSISNSNTHSRQRKQFPLERRPQMLKDFLLDDSNSCSSNGFKSFPRKANCQDPSSSSIRNLIQIELKSNHAEPNYAQKLQRSRSKASSTTISAFQAMINAFKNIHLITSVKSPSILPRSLSRKLSRKNSQSKQQESDREINVPVRVKDIIRWKSFRDLAEEKTRPSDFASSPHYCTTTTITTTTTGSTCTPCSSNGSSWCDSDFTSEYLPSYEYGENEGEAGKKFLPCVGKDPMDQTTTEEAANKAMGPKGRKDISEEKELQSPLSVLDLQYEDDDHGESFFNQYEDDDHGESFFNSTFNRSLETMERRKQKLMQRIQCFENLAKLEPINLEKWFSLEEDGEDNDDEEDKDEDETNEVEEKAWELFNRVHETSNLKSYMNISAEKLILDLFRDELSTKWNQTRDEELEHDMVRVAKAWISGEQNKKANWREGEKREACVKDMEREGRWRSKFEEEQEELALEVETSLINILVDELLVDL